MVEQHGASQKWVLFFFKRHCALNSPWIWTVTRRRKSYILINILWRWCCFYSLITVCVYTFAVFTNSLSKYLEFIKKNSLYLFHTQLNNELKNFIHFFHSWICYFGQQVWSSNKKSISFSMGCHNRDHYSKYGINGCESIINFNLFHSDIVSVITVYHFAQQQQYEYFFYKTCHYYHIGFKKWKRKSVNKQKQKTYTQKNNLFFFCDFNIPYSVTLNSI